MKHYRILRTTNFRLSALYMLLILLSLAVLCFAVWFLTVHMLESQLRNTIHSNLIQLQQAYKVEGEQNLIAEINEKENINAWDTPDYALIDPDGKKIAGSLPLISYHEGWQVFPGPPEHELPHEKESIYAEARHLDNGWWLVVGEDGEFIEDFGETIFEAFAWGALLVIALGIPCGIYLSRSFLNKIAGLTRSTQAIINGDLSHRLAVSHAGDELDGLAELLNRMLDQINALIANVQQVSNDIAHDLRTPLTRLRQKLDDAQRMAMTAEDYRTRIGLAIGEIDTILATFSALLRIAQIESGSRRGEFKHVNLSDLITYIVETLWPVAEENGKTITSCLETGLIVLGDRELLAQMAVNLIENAIQHTPQGSNIDVTLQRTANYITLGIADNGRGIPLHLHEKIFQRFYRIEQSRNTPGNGLGLSIVKAIADLHGVKINVSDNKPGLNIAMEFIAIQASE